MSAQKHDICTHMGDEAAPVTSNLDSLEDCGRHIRRVAVLGSGVMGAQIAAHLANADLQVLLFELPSSDGDRNAHVRKALLNLKKIKPNPLASPSCINNIQAANYADDLQRLTDCDLVIEAITERLDLKQDLYCRLTPHLGEWTVLATNTSGISIEQLAHGLPDAVRWRFCGLHFFNPPRYMHLLELIPHHHTGSGVLRNLEGFVTTVLGKGVVRAKDTCSFIANRVGVFSLLAVMHHAQRLGLPPDLVDKLTGSGIGRAKSATFRTLDVVGLDVFAHVVRTLQENAGDDPWRDHYRVPEWIQGLIEQGALGQKTRSGIYKKQDGAIHVFDPNLRAYRRVQSALDARLRDILAMPNAEKKYAALLGCDHPQAEFLRSIFAELYHFCAYHLKDIADSARDLDLAMRWGYGWRMGPLESWQMAGWQRVSAQVGEMISRGEMMSSAALPEWVTDPGRQGVHQPDGSWSPTQHRVLPRSNHPVYRRQPFPELLAGETRPAVQTLFENAAVQLWQDDDGIAVLSFKTKMHTVTDAVLKGVLKAVEIAEQNSKALVLWHPEAPFCAGANLMEIFNAQRSDKQHGIREVVKRFQNVSMALKHSTVPTVAAVQGLALGGGCELLMHCDRVVAALESYPGLVEVGVGLVPAGGGCKELVIRVSDAAQGGDLLPFISRYFERVALAKVASSALEARQWGYLRAADRVVFNPHELLHAAKYEGLALFEGGYRPPLRRHDIRVAGRAAAATLQAQLLNMREGGFISAHDFEIGKGLAAILCGGELEPGSQVSDDWLLQLELETFLSLLETEKTRQRIKHMLETGKPLRN